MKFGSFELLPCCVLYEDLYMTYLTATWNTHHTPPNTHSLTHSPSHSHIYTHPFIRIAFVLVGEWVCMCFGECVYIYIYIYVGTLVCICVCSSRKIKIVSQYAKSF